jgi:hypothetical protein
LLKLVERESRRISLSTGNPSVIQLGFEHMGDQVGSATTTILVSVEQRSAELALAKARPAHRPGCHLPTRSARNARHLVIVLLMASAAAHPRHTVTVGAALDIHQMVMVIVALSRAIAARMTTYAAPALQYRCDSAELLRALAC